MAAAEDQLDMESEDEFGNVVIKKRMNRQIEEGVYAPDLRNNGLPVSNNQIVEGNNDLDAVDEDEFDRILENERKVQKSRSK